MQVFSSNVAKLWTIDEANTARTTSTIVGAVQNIDATGKVSPAGDTLNNAPYAKVTSYDSDGNEMFKPNNLGYMAIGDGKNPNLDAFGRLRISNPVTLFESQHQYNELPLFWGSVLTGSGTATHLPNESAMRLRCTTASGDKVVRQTKEYFRYQAGKSQLIEMTGVMGAKKANVRQRIGYFDGNNGLFFEQDENNLKVVRRTYVTGSPVDNATNQSSWNIDTMDGNGPSGVTLDMSKTHIFVIDFQWLGVGRVRFGFVVDGNLYYCHEILNANTLTEVYMTTGNLPLRYEIENTGTAASNTDLKQICCTVQSEGGYEDDLGIQFSSGMGTGTLGVTTRVPIFSIQLKSTFNSITNRGTVIPLAYDILAQTNSAYYEIVYNGTLTGASFSSVDSNSLCNEDTSATAISGGIVIADGYINADTKAPGSIENAIKNKLKVTNDVAGTTGDIISIVITSMNLTTTVSGSLTWKELY